MKFAVIDNNTSPMNPDNGRGQGFANALSNWTFGDDYEFVYYDQIDTRRRELMSCRGLILTGSALDLALPNGDFDRATYEAMGPEYRLILDFKGPVLGVCFGHQLMALADEYDSGRTDFSGLRVRNMPQPRGINTVTRVKIHPTLRFSRETELWAQFHHKQEVVRNEGLLRYYDVLAQSDRCEVDAMQHKTRDWYGVQFHPEIGKDTVGGILSRHEDAVKDGRSLLSDFVRFSLQSGAH